MNGTVTEELYVSLIHAPVNIIFAVVMYSIGIFCTVGNVLAIYVLLRARKLLHPPTKPHTSLILFNLALAGVFIGILWCPVCATQLLTKKFRNSSSFENVRRFLGIELPGAFIGIIISISYDRFLIIKHSTNHNKQMTKRKAVLLIAISWLFPLPVPILRFINKFVFTYIVVFVILFGFAVVAITYLYMLHIVSGSERRVKRAMQFDATNPAMLYKPDNQDTAKAPLRRLNKTLRLTKTASVLILTYLICHIPFAIFLLIRMFRPTLVSPYISQLCFLISECLTQINASLNPGIYFMTSTAYVKEIRKMIAPKLKPDFDTIATGVEMRHHKITPVSPLPSEGVPRLMRVQTILG